jgi:precorrin-4 methylase
MSEGLTDAQIERIRELRANGETCCHTARRLKVPVEVVRALVPPKSGPYRKPPYSIEKVRALRRQGLTFPEIGCRTGVSAMVASRLCRDIELTPEQRLAIQQATGVKSNVNRVERLRALAKERHHAHRVAETRRKISTCRRKPGPVKMPERVDVEVPRWVPGTLRDLYVELADRDCEESAASVVRQIKSAGSVACR